MTPPQILPPIFNEVPFKKIKIPTSLNDLIQTEYKQMVLNFKEIEGPIDWNDEVKKYVRGGISVGDSKSPRVLLSPMSSNLHEECFKTLTPIMEDWCHQKLDRVNGYGVRNYVNDSTLILHRDVFNTHLISCIIFIDQNSEKNWPLDFFDHQHKHHKVYFEPGEMLLYESLCVHGRIEPFNGHYYRNMYFHWKPTNWDSKPYEPMKCAFKSKEDFENYYTDEQINDTKHRIVNHAT